MRVLFTVQPSVGHLHPLVPVARALSEAGHDLVVGSAPAFRGDVEAFGLRYEGAGLDWQMSDQSTWEAFPPMPPPGPQFPAWVVLTLADITTRRMVPDLLAFASDWKPDLIIREGMEQGGCIAADVLGIPHASIAGNAYAAIDSAEINYFPGNRRMLAEPPARHRVEFGLPPDPELAMPFHYLHLCFTPPAWDGDSVPRPRNGPGCAGCASGSHGASASPVDQSEAPAAQVIRGAVLTIVPARTASAEHSLRVVLLLHAPHALEVGAPVGAVLVG